jgi:hypothetical protein
LYTGTNWFFGDVGGKNGVGRRFVKDMDFSNTKPLIGIWGGYNFSDNFSVRLNAQISSVAAKDSRLNPNDGNGRFYRNLSFKSGISEFSAGAQYNWRRYTDNALDVWETNKLSYTVFAGIGIFHFDPKAFYKGTWVKLHQLRTEGQGMAEYPNRKPYKLTQFFIPFSGGINYHVNTNWNLRAELMFRKTFTDYVDDVSTTYIDPALFDKYLPADLSGMAKSLYNRNGEINSGVNLYNKGEARGKPNNDTWVSFNIGLIYNIGL